MAINYIPLYMAYEIPTKNRGKQGKKDKSLFKGNRRDCKHNKANRHMARKTFASTVLLYNDVPMEIVSELLGHSNMGIVISGIINEPIIIRGKCIPQRG
jgi:integrase